jgi:hypothetical protein
VIIWQFTDRIKLPGLPVMDGNYLVEPEYRFWDLVDNSAIIPTGDEEIEIARIRLGLVPFRRNVERVMENISQRKEN